MPRIEFLASALGPAMRVEIDGPVALVDVCDDAHAPVAFSCRSASCGSCRVDVLDGWSLLEPARAEELEVLALFDAEPSHRLACQAKARASDGLVRLRWVDD